MASSTLNVNVFLRAETAEEIVRLQLINNAVNNKHYNYQTPVYDGESWVIWFFADVRNWKNPEDLSEEEIKNSEGVNV